MKNIIIFGVLLTVFTFSCLPKNKKSSTIIKNAAIEKIRQSSNNHILVCAHRSFHKNAPENSLQSITNAINAKIDFIEIDIRTTKDSLLVLMHDKTIDRVTTGNGLLHDFTYKELQQFNLKIGDSITTQKIPLVIDALKLAKNKIIPNLDLKAVNYQQLYTMLQSLGMQHEVISFIGKKKKVQEMLTIDSLYAVLPLVKTKNDMMFYQQYTISTLQHVTDESFIKSNMEWMHKNEQLVFVNTLWDEDEDFAKGNTESMDSVIALKPAIIQTDYPKLLLDYLKRKSLHN